MTENATRPQCPVCKQVLAPGVRYCPHDGTPLTETSAKNAANTPTGTRPFSREIALPAVVGGRYRLVAVRGGGGMAKVYKAVDLTLGRDVAVKLINPELRTEREFDNRFQREARIASQLTDPHIVVVHDFGLDPEHGPFLVMEYLQGQSLRERLSTEGPMPLKAGLQLAGQLFLALISAHQKNVVHRDIKPDNIFLLNQSGVRLHIRVLDFGIARIFRSDVPSDAETLTSPGAVLGTPRYMSPEQLAGQTVDARSDLYSTAMVIHEAMSGQLPYVSGKSFCELVPEATAELQELLYRCLRPNPNERPPSALEVYLQLQDLGKASGVVLLPPGALDQLIAARRSEDATVRTPREQPATTVRVGLPRGRRRLLVAGLALFSGLMALALIIGAFSGKPTPASAAESLLDVKVGAPFDATVDRLSLTRGPARPWSPGGTRPASLGHVLEAADLGVPDDDLARVEVRWSQDETVAVAGLDEAVLAVVIRKGELYKAYDEDSTPRTTSHQLPAEEGGGHGEARHYDPLGVAFFIHKGHVASITLYPPKPAQ
jgi:hypothetical protein